MMIAVSLSATLWLKILNCFICVDTVKSVLSSHSKRRQKQVFKTNYSIMQVKSLAECSKGNILLPAVIKIFVLSILSGRLRQALL